MTRILRLAAAGLLIGAATPALAMNICVEGAYPPFSETSADGSIVGFDIDIANALCAQMGQSCAMVKVDWDGIIPALLEKKCDAISDGRFSSKKRGARRIRWRWTRARTSATTRSPSHETK